MVLTLAVGVIFAVGTAMAVPPGKNVTFEGGTMGKVVFDGKIHSAAGNKCNSCHPKVFKMKRGSVKITAPHKPGEFCGTCHKGEPAFAQEGNCARCHTK